MSEHSNYCDHPVNSCLYEKEIKRLQAENACLLETIRQLREHVQDGNKTENACNDSNSP